MRDHLTQSAAQQRITAQPHQHQLASFSSPSRPIGDQRCLHRAEVSANEEPGLRLVVVGWKATYDLEAAASSLLQTTYMMMAWLAYISHSHAFMPNKEPKNLYNIDKKARFCISALIYGLLFAFISHNIRRWSKSSCPSLRKLPSQSWEWGKPNIFDKRKYVGGGVHVHGFIAQ